MTKSELLSQVKEYYLMSRDFNGLPICKITDYNIEDIVSLINDNLIEILSENDVINPHIKGFNLKLSKEHQIENIKDTKKLSCLYPTPKALKDAEIDNVAPYTAKLRSGEAQFQIVYFNIEILERYINNPKYLIIDYGYRGEICLKDEYWSEDQESEYVKNYGMAYKKGESIDRAVAVFLGDLAKLPQRRQLLWKSFEANNQNNYDVAEGFIKNLIYGGWVTTYWIFDAVLEEMKVINDLCSAIGIPGLFNHIYGTFYDEKPDGYSNILLPTLKNYYEFVLVIEKLIVHNISVKTFTKNDDEVFGAYSHMGGKMVSIVKLADGDEEKARDIAMHVAAINPKYISQDEIPQVEKDREDAVQTEIMANDPKLANKPEKVLEGIKRGKLNKVFSEWCLLDQEFIKTPKESVAKYLGKAKVLEMARFQVGEGIEKKEENFAEEVAAQMKQ